MKVVRLIVKIVPITTGSGHLGLATCLPSRFGSYDFDFDEDLRQTSCGMTSNIDAGRV